MKKVLPKRRKTAKKKALVGAKLLRRNPVANTQKAIENLLDIAKNKKRKTLLRKAASTLANILEHTPRDGRKIIRRLVQADKTHNLSISTVVRILAAPLAFTTIKRHLREFANKQISLSRLMGYVEGAYERQVPHKIMDQVLHCRQGHFYNRIWKTAIVYRSPKSLITNATIKRMHILKRPAEEINEANAIKWEIHSEAHKMYEAIRKRDKKAQADSTKKIRGMQSAFINRFTKKL